MTSSASADLPRFPGSTATTVDLAVATLAIYVLSPALPIMTLQVYDRILPNTGTGTLSVLVVGVCVAVGLEVVLPANSDCERRPVTGV